MPCTNWLEFVLLSFPNRELLSQALDREFPNVVLSPEEWGFVQRDGKWSWDNYQPTPAAQRAIRTMGPREFARRIKVAYSEQFVQKFARKVKGKVTRRETDAEIVLTVGY